MREDNGTNEHTNTGPSVASANDRIANASDVNASTAPAEPNAGFNRDSNEGANVVSNGADEDPNVGADCVWTDGNANDSSTNTS